MKKASIEVEIDEPRGRHGFKFEVDAATLERAATSKAAYHRDREAHWQGEVNRVEPLRKESAQVTEQQVTGGVQQYLRYDPGLDAEYNAARNKRDSHKDYAEEYEGWAQGFKFAQKRGTNPAFYLTIDDIVYFEIR